MVSSAVERAKRFSKGQIADDVKCSEAEPSFDIDQRLTLVTPMGKFGDQLIDITFDERLLFLHGRSGESA